MSPTGLTQELPEGLKRRGDMKGEQQWPVCTSGQYNNAYVEDKRGER